MDNVPKVQMCTSGAVCSPVEWLCCKLCPNRTGAGDVAACCCALDDYSCACSRRRLREGRSVVVVVEARDALGAALALARITCRRCASRAGSVHHVQAVCTLGDCYFDSFAVVSQTCMCSSHKGGPRLADWKAAIPLGSWMLPAARPVWS